MRIDILTLFPEMVKVPLAHSIVGRACDSGVMDIHMHNIRDYTADKHRTVDDAPFGGGSGMVMKSEPLYNAIKSIDPDNKAKKILTDASGGRFDQVVAKKLILEDWLLIICGHYKGVDERIKQLYDLYELSIGDYVLTGGEIPAMVIIDAVARLVPGAIKEISSAESDSYFDGLLGYPEYTQPREFMEMSVPEVLTSGNHELIKRWRLQKSLKKTLARRPDLLENRKLDDEEKELLYMEDNDVKSS